MLNDDLYVFGYTLKLVQVGFKQLLGKIAKIVSPLFTKTHWEHELTMMESLGSELVINIELLVIGISSLVIYNYNMTIYIFVIS